MHERSQTIERNGKFVNVYGPGATGGKPGKRLAPKYDFERRQYDTLDEAVNAARRRSLEEGKRGIK